MSELPGPESAEGGEQQGEGGETESAALQGAASAAAAEAFRVRCPDCGPQVVPISEIRYVETGDDATANRYMFACPECGERIRRPAGPEISEILRSSGVATLALHRGSGEAV